MNKYLNKAMSYFSISFIMFILAILGHPDNSQQFNPLTNKSECYCALITD